MASWSNQFPETSGDELKNANLLWTVAVILLVVWLVGIVSASTLGGLLHLLLPLALLSCLGSAIQRERADS